MTQSRSAVRAFIALGSNVGYRGRHLQQGVESLAQASGVKVVQVSTVYENEAHTLDPAQVHPPFLNAVIEIETVRTPEELLSLLFEIERDAGRIQSKQWEPRPLDLDLLLYGDQVISGKESMIVPHPRMLERRFVLQPLSELAPDVVIPGTGKTVLEALKICPDKNPLEATSEELLATQVMFPETLRYIAVEGVIGAGKTTLARMLARQMKARLVLEEFEENPFLPDFYKDADRWAFHTQLAFLASRFKQQKPLLSRDLFHQRTISDYTFDKDRIFAHITLTGDELVLYESLYTLMEPTTATPDLVVYLRSSTDRLMQNIASRDREYERNMQRDYIAELTGAYDHYFNNYSRGPLLIINSTELDFVNKRKDFEELMSMIAEAV